MMRLGLIVEPEHAGLILAAPYQIEIDGRQKIRRGFSEWSQDLLRRPLLPYSFDLPSPRSIGHKLRIALRFSQKCVHGRHICPFAGLVSLNQLPHRRTQSSGCLK